MLTLASRFIGAVIVGVLALVGAKEVGKTVWSWKKAHNDQKGSC